MATHLKDAQIVSQAVALIDDYRQETILGAKNNGSNARGTQQRRLRTP
jgi:hypothetical protein